MSKKSIRSVVVWLFILTLVLSGCTGGKKPPIGFKPGSPALYKVGDGSFYMRYAPAGTFVSDDPAITASEELPGAVEVSEPFWMAETEVTYALWKEVYDWATHPDRGEQRYTFRSPGQMGSRDTESAVEPTPEHPVTGLTWFDTLVWCNALTECYHAEHGQDLVCVYRADNGSPIRDASDDFSVLPDLAANGFRLPSSAEWQLAARYQTNGAWTPGSHASGDTTGPCWTEDGMGVSTAFRDYLWDWTNSGMSTQPVGTKDANALGIRDMSGNIAEWCFDDFPSTGWSRCCEVEVTGVTTPRPCSSAWSRNEGRSSTGMIRVSGLPKLYRC